MPPVLQTFQMEPAESLLWSWNFKNQYQPGLGHLRQVLSRVHRNLVPRLAAFLLVSHAQKGRVPGVENGYIAPVRMHKQGLGSTFGAFFKTLKRTLEIKKLIDLWIREQVNFNVLSKQSRKIKMCGFFFYLLCRPKIKIDNYNDKANNSDE